MNTLIERYPWRVARAANTLDRVAAHGAHDDACQRALRRRHESVRVRFRGGLEHSRGRLQLRAAAAFADDAWLPTAGLGVPVSQGVWLDLAAFTTSANVQRQRRYVQASSTQIRSR
jgi:hypothetical protein